MLCTPATELRLCFLIIAFPPGLPTTNPALPGPPAPGPPIPLMLPFRPFMGPPVLRIGAFEAAFRMGPLIVLLRIGPVEGAIWPWPSE